MLLYEARRGKRAHPIFQRVFAQGSLRARAAYQSQSGKSGGVKKLSILKSVVGNCRGPANRSGSWKSNFSTRKSLAVNLFQNVAAACKEQPE